MKGKNYADIALPLANIALDSKRCVFEILMAPFR